MVAAPGALWFFLLGSPAHLPLWVRLTAPMLPQHILAELFQGLCLPAHLKAWYPLESSWTDCQGASFFRKMPFDSFVSARASSSVGHELCTGSITLMFMELKTTQWLR